MRAERPSTAEQAAEALRAADAEGLTVRPVGGGTKLGWGRAVPEPDIELQTAGLARILEHNAADLTGVAEAGVPLAEAQAAFAEAGQMVALDPPLGAGSAATIGGVVAAGDSGPLRHRYGAPRDLVLGVTVALADGALAHAGGKVIKNVAGYDLAKLMAGSFGTLGVIVQMALRLHPLPGRRVTALGASDDAEALQAAAQALARAPLELESLDIAWDAGAGLVLARCAGAAPQPRAGEASRLMSESGLSTELAEDDDALWSQQRDAQRSSAGAVVRVSGRQSELARTLRAAQSLGASVTGRAGLGLLWIGLPKADDAAVTGAVETLRRSLDPLPCVLLDAPLPVRQKLDPWGDVEPAAGTLMRRVKERFDPQATLNRGIFVEGI